MEELWPGCINGAVSHHFRTSAAMGAQRLGPQPVSKVPALLDEGVAMTQALVN